MGGGGGGGVAVSELASVVAALRVAIRAVAAPGPLPASAASSAPPPLLSPAVLVATAAVGPPPLAVAEPGEVVAEAGAALPSPSVPPCTVPVPALDPVMVPVLFVLLEPVLLDPGTDPELLEPVPLAGAVLAAGRGVVVFGPVGVQMQHVWAPPPAMDPGPDWHVGPSQPVRVASILQTVAYLGGGRGGAGTKGERALDWQAASAAVLSSL